MARVGCAMSDARLIAGLCGANLILAVMSFLAGAVSVPPSALVDLVLGEQSGFAEIVLGSIRAPRIALAILIGFALGLAGACIQGLLRNPLAEPGLLGASNAAALGAVMVIYLGLAGTLSFAVPIAAAGGALLSVLLLLKFAGSGASSLRLILAGFALSALAGACISLALNLSPNAFAALEIAFWLLGALENRSWTHAWFALPGLALGCALMLRAGRGIDALSLGTEVAQTLGVNLTRLRVLIALGLALAVGSAVAVAGVIGFVGLLAPHFVRPFTGHLPSRSLLPAGLVGALILLLADTLVRLVPTQMELKLGVVTAFLGVPFLLYLLKRDVLGDDRA